jgi:hypothetical protein
LTPPPRPSRLAGYLLDELERLLKAADERTAG